MPIYRIRDNETGEVTEHFLKYEEMKAMVAESEGRLTNIIGTPMIVSGVGGLKVTDSHREVIAKIKETHKVNTIKDF